MMPPKLRDLARAAKIGDTFEIRGEDRQRYSGAFNAIGWRTTSTWINADTLEFRVIDRIEERAHRTFKTKHLATLGKLTADQLGAVVKACEQNGMFK